MLLMLDASLTGSRRPFARVVAACLLVLALLAGAFVPSRANAVEPLNVRIHFHLDNNEYGRWGLYVWGAGLVLAHSVTWDRPLEPTGVDRYGIYFDVGVEPTVHTFNLIVHRGDVKSTPRDMAVDIATQGREVWVREGTDEVYAKPPAIDKPYAVGVEVEQTNRRTLQWSVGGGVLGVVLVVLGWCVVGRRLASSREQLAANMQLLVQAQSELRAQGERMQGIATDELTGLPTRAGLQQALEQALARAARQEDGVVGVMFIDLDGFKQVNDTGGHDAGDEVLRTVARRLRAAVRECDVVARVGGDEFVVLVESVISPMQAFVVGRKLVRAAAQEIVVNGQTFRVGASVGIALSPDDGSEAAALLKAADTAMYETKRAGKGACRFVQAQRQADLERQLALEQALRVSLDREELTLAMEPIVEFASGRVVGRKATLHWLVEGEAVQVQPVVYASDDAALSRQVERWLFTHACRAAAAQSTPGQQPFVSITLGAGAADQAELPNIVRDVLAEEGLPPQRLQLVFPVRRLADPQRSLDALVRLRSQGVRIGFAGINQIDIGLQRLVMAPVDQLELDVRTDAGPLRGTPYVRALAALGGQLGYAVAAIGVTTAAQRRWAEAAGCTMGSGAACEEVVAAQVA